VPAQPLVVDNAGLQHVDMTISSRDREVKKAHCLFQRGLSRMCRANNGKPCSGVASCSESLQPLLALRRDARDCTDGCNLVAATVSAGCVSVRPVPQVSHVWIDQAEGSRCMPQRVKPILVYIQSMCWIRWKRPHYPGACEVLCLCAWGTKCPCCSLGF
jgi:hypothetical protein